MTRERFLSVEDAASQLGIKPVTVRAHVARGNLKAQKLAGALWIEPDEMQRFQRERRPRGHKGAARKTSDWDIVRSQAVQLETSPEPPGALPSGAPHENAAPDARDALSRRLTETPESVPERTTF